MISERKPLELYRVQHMTLLCLFTLLKATSLHVTMQCTPEAGYRINSEIEDAYKYSTVALAPFRCYSCRLLEINNAKERTSD